MSTEKAPVVELQIRDVLHSRLLRSIEGDAERWRVATAMANHLALAGLVPLPDGQTRYDGKVYEVQYELDADEQQPGTTIWNRCLVPVEDTP